MPSIILADNQAIFRAGICRVLASEPDLRIVRQCADLEALKIAIDHYPQSIVLFPSSLSDAANAIMNWIDGADSRSIMILEHGATADELIAERLDGMVLRSVAATQLIECIHRVAAGERRVRHSSSATAPSQDRVGTRVLERLTPKELEIIALVTDGAKNREIAVRLNTKEQVVKNYLRAIYDKTGVSDRLELALYTVHHPALAHATETMRGRGVKQE